MFSPELLPTGNHILPKCALVFFVCILYCGQNVANVAKHKLNSLGKMLGSTFWRAQILGIQAFLTFWPRLLRRKIIQFSLFCSS